MKRITLVLVLLILAGCKEQIVHQLSEEDANRYLARLHSGQFEAEKVRLPDSTWAIAVPRSDSAAAIQFLSRSRLFRRSHGDASESRSFLVSREEERFRFERAMSREVEATLTAIDGVLEARVHLNLPPRDPLFGVSREGDGAASASVLLITSRDLPLSNDSIRELIAGAAGVPLEGVSVLTSQSQEEIDLPNFAHDVSSLGRFSTWRGRELLLFPFALLFLVAGVFFAIRGRLQNVGLKPRFRITFNSEKVSQQ
ncbi:MAG: hypothetical protein KDD64_01600 [Bdellovibrionales bacterium]|nr:hypothetical protein [Bdellovibrionales bacterium]